MEQFIFNFMLQAYSIMCVLIAIYVVAYTINYLSNYIKRKYINKKHN